MANKTNMIVEIRYDTPELKSAKTAFVELETEFNNNFESCETIPQIAERAKKAVLDYLGDTPYDKDSVIFGGFSVMLKSDTVYINTTTPA